MENDDLSELEVVNEQPKLVDSGVVDIPLDARLKEELDGPPAVKEKPSYLTRAVAARQRVGLGVKSEPRQPRGVEVRADDVIVIDDDGYVLVYMYPYNLDSHIGRTSKLSLTT